MKKIDNQNGMAISGILYTLLVLFLALLFGILGIIASGKNALETVKKDVYLKLNNMHGETEYVKLKYPNGSAVYFNPVDWTKCTDYTIYNSNTLVKEGCMKWYTFNDTEDSNTVNLILDHNTTALLAWNTTANNTSMAPLITALETDTATWKEKDTIRIITANEVAKITEADTILNFDAITKTCIAKWFFLDGKYGTDATWQTQYAGSTIKSSYGWLFDNTYNAKSYGGNFNDDNKYTYDDSGTKQIILGYWTSTKDKGSSDIAWYVQHRGRLYYNRVDYAYRSGVRPVITVSKKLIQ